MSVFSTGSSGVHFKAYDGQLVDARGNTSVIGLYDVSMTGSVALFGTGSMYMAAARDAVRFGSGSVFDVGTGVVAYQYMFRTMMSLRVIVFTI